MIVKSHFSAESLIHRRHLERVENMLLDYQDEAAESAIDKNPRRANYIEYMSQRVAEIAMQPPRR